MPNSVPLLLLALLQQVPTTTLPAADARSKEGFTSIFAVHELPDGRVLVTDNLENVIRLVDLQAGTVRQLGRHGSGPLEYRAAHTILPGSHDTVLVTDNVLRRFVKIVGGAIVGVEMQPAILLNGRSFSAPIADARGALHWDVRELDMRDSGFEERHGHVLRWVPGSARIDTVAVLHVDQRAPRRNVGYNPFVFRDAWGVAADGSIALVRTDPYRVEWITSGDHTVGASIPYQPVRINAAERDAERIAFTQRGRSSASLRGPPQEPRTATPEIRSRIPDDVFPAHKPPFTVSRVLVSPVGEVWIPRAAAWAATATIIDVVHRDAQLRRHIRVPANMRVVGFGRSAAYAALRDDDDLEWLVRIPLGAAGRSVP